MNMADAGIDPKVRDSQADAAAELRARELKRRIAQAQIPGTVVTQPAQAAPAPPAVTPQPAPAPAQAPPPAPQPVTQQIDPTIPMMQTLAGLGEQFVKQSSEAQTALKSAGEKKAALVRPAIESIATQAQRPQPPPPTLKAEPPLTPDVKPRPFLSPEGATALQTVVAGIGSLVTSLAGLSAPVGALNALTGAMEGWAEGDAARVAHQWQKYEAAVNKVQRENATALHEWDLARTNRADDMGAAQALLQARLAEAGLSDHAALVSEKSADRTMQMIGMYQTMLHNYQTHENKMLRDILMAERFSETKRHHGVIEAQQWARPTVTEVVDPNDPKRTIKIDARTNKIIGEGTHSQEYQTETAAMKYFTSGLGGRSIIANNTAINHLDLLEQYAKALKTNDQRTLNRLTQTIQKEFGLSSAPSAFAGIARLAAAEVVKTVAASGGGVEERAAEAKDFDPALAPDVLIEVIRSKKQILKGKTDAMRGMYDTLGLEEKLGPFDKYLSSPHKDTGPTKSPSKTPTVEELLEKYK